MFPDILPNDLIITAQNLHPEQLCVKNVHAGMVLRTTRGDIYMYGRNGMHDASLSHLREFSVGSLRQRAQSELTYPKLAEFFSGMPSKLDDWVIGCRYILEKSGCAYCLMGHPWFKSITKNQSKVQEAKVACPNNRAGGCTERLFLNTWMPYAIELQNDLIDRYKILEEGEPLAINHIQFTHPDDPFADIEFAIGNGNDASWLKIEGILPSKADLHGKISAILVATQYTPCEDCASAFHNHPLKDILQVHIRELSRHTVDTLVPGIQLDEGDIRALTQMIKDRIPVSFDDWDKIRLLRRV